MKNTVFWDVMPCGSYKNRRFIRVTIGELGTTSVVTSNRHMLLVTANVVPISPIPVTPMMEALSSSETSHAA
jgi:hypothetical protein